MKLVVDTYYTKEPSSYTGMQKIVYTILINLDYTFTAIFVVELSLKVISSGKIYHLGLIMDFNSYLRDSWSLMDFVIVSFSLLDILLSGSNLGFIKIVRMLRILRPLRFISNNPSLKILVNSLFESMFGLANVTIVICMIW